MSKRAIIIVVVLALLVSILFLSIPKQDLPTEEQWSEHMDYVNSPEFQNQFR